MHPTLQTNPELTLRRPSGGHSVTLSPYHETTDARPLFDLTPDGNFTAPFWPADGNKGLQYSGTLSI
ncbi:MAG TPA: hypothetical protein VHN77_00940, partial [Phycisphaerales bacterium]|nr:hypothetical protein [Phycisphaerales bacterium]